MISPSYIMKPLKSIGVGLFVKFTIVVISLWMVFLISQPKTSWKPTDIFSNSWLYYTGADGSLESLCNCTALLQGNTNETEKAKILLGSSEFRKSVQIPDEYYINATQDCSAFKVSRKYLTFPLSQEEKDFPLAYSMVVHHKVQNFERLLRAIYAPQNIYCVHVDKKSKLSIRAAITAIASCFPNVLMVSQPVDVVYASWSRVQADLNCMADLYRSSTQWKYLINLCGQDFPLKTNLEMVRMLSSLKGRNSLESVEPSDSNKWRVKKIHEIVNGTIQTTEKDKEPPPFNLPIRAGSAYIVVSRGYIHSVLNDDKIQKLFEWAKDTYSPDEFVWATIQRITRVPGSSRINYKHDLSEVSAFARLVKWQDQEGPPDSYVAVYPECHGTHVRAVCVYGVGDLQWMLEQHHLFANKFDTDSDSIVIYCLEKYLRQKALDRKVY